MRKRHSPEQIAQMLREVAAEVSGGGTVVLACQKLGISEQTYYRWRNQYNGDQGEEARRLKELESENARLKKLVAELALEKQTLQDMLRGK